MSIKTQRLIGVTLFLIGLALGLITNLLAADPEVQTWYKQYRTWILIVAALFALVGIILTIASISKNSHPKLEKKNGESSTPSLANEDEEHLRELLAKRQQNLRTLQLQKSIYAAGEEPLHLLNQIAAEEKALKEIEQQLRK
jgi:hypothetical protein